MPKISWTKSREGFKTLVNILMKSKNTQKHLRLKLPIKSSEGRGQRGNLLSLVVTFIAMQT